MKNSNDTIGNRTRDLPVCSVVPQPTAPTATPIYSENLKKLQTYHQKGPSLFWDVTRCRLSVTDVSGQHIGPHLQARNSPRNKSHIYSSASSNFLNQDTTHLHDCWYQDSNQGSLLYLLSRKCFSEKADLYDSCYRNERIAQQFWLYFRQ